MKGPFLDSKISNGSGRRYSYDEDGIHRRLLIAGFSPYQYYLFERRLEPLNEFGSYNTGYIQDISFIRQRLAEADKIWVLNKEF